MGTIINITKRELNGYFSTPVAYVFIVIFLLMAGTHGYTYFLYQQFQCDYGLKKEEMEQ